MKIRWLLKAERNIEDIADYIAQDNQLAADETIEKIRRGAEVISQHPYIGKQGRVTGTHEFVVMINYILVYRIKNNQIHILQVLHSARQWPGGF